MADPLGLRGDVLVRGGEDGVSPCRAHTSKLGRRGNDQYNFVKKIEQKHQWQPGNAMANSELDTQALKTLPNAK